MTKQELFDFIANMYEKWKPLDFEDMYYIEQIELDIMFEILKYSYENKLEIPGYDLNEIFAFIYRDKDSEDYNPDDDTFDILEIYIDIAEKLYSNEIVVPDEYLEIKYYFEKMFWPDQVD